MEKPPSAADTVPVRLGLEDAVSIIIGIVIGAGIYETPPMVFRQAPSAWVALAIWALAGLLCLIGALCYAELASTYPRLGGDYVYLTRAYGAPVGFLYGWSQLALIQTGSIGMMAYVFADYAVKLWNFGSHALVLYAAGAVTILSLLNLLGVVLGKGTQNLLTLAKVLGLGGILIAGFSWGKAAPAEPRPGLDLTSLAGLLVPIFLTYGGWNDAAFVAAELRQPRRNIPLALILGTAGVTFLYLAANAAYLFALGLERAGKSEAIAADVLGLALGESGYKAMCILVMISALGAVNGLIFTSSRIYAKLGSEHRLFSRLGRWHPRLQTPVWSLVIQAVIGLILIVGVGTETGRWVIDSVLRSVLRSVGQEKAWRGAGGFQPLLQCTAPVFWSFFLLSAVSLFILRWKDRHIERPFSVPLFPVVPLIFCATCAYMLYGSIGYAGYLGLVGAALVLVGVPLYFLSGRMTSSE
jgi:basic amino acid/polyamine antiporter, APA family